MQENIIEFGQLPATLTDQYNFEEIFKLKPKGRSSVLVYDKTNEAHFEKQIFRSYTAYLNVPEFDDTIKKSYMFSNKENELPSEFIPLLNFAKSIDDRFNQVVVNWYEPEDYIEPHRDCTANMIDKSAPILCINLNESNTRENSRHLLLEPLQTGEKQKLTLSNNTYYILKDNLSVRHSVGKGSERRIAITFRMMKEGR